MEFSLFYFADNEFETGARGGYELLLEGAKYADRHGFAAVWTPERHFHRIGALYPNPSVTGAAVAAVTERIAIRAGSVVPALHHPLRIAEEWSVVDNLSNGRAGISFASGWDPVDFVLSPEAYADRRNAVLEAMRQVRGLWRGDRMQALDGNGDQVDVRVYPGPVQPELPVWLTSAGSPDTFRAAGEAGAGVLTHLLGQSMDELAEKTAVYRKALAERPDHDGWPGHVALMLHAFVGEDPDVVLETVREPFIAYLKSSFNLITRSAPDTLKGLDLGKLSDAHVDFLVRRSFDRYYRTSGLFGTVEQAGAIVEQARTAGVDELACFIDFGVPTDKVLAGLEHLDRLKESQ
ncbi:MupA/Atu3671 family FMN-dependent luciferase-like monooxygenase [Kitasatospora sp. GP82]|uniref:MupA/Atu3671 family FMN-dependent luciferase-like monooxygenase n=1 Tax=Kitasatospora sp. GP82 TaxID=3035089 RepID=UPI002475C03E|nr:MupA/Atu3671 family FMN-dependent luciferase-like monooxygenase [Kitasatospora sp. GP82]MDH6128338.1 natural product biosynthesis luciferase-like monooxygenase protein [Kitasatospora sp. GP82]